MFVRLRPNIVSTKLRMKNERNTITSPITAAIIWLRAASTFDESPDDVIHLIPPITKKIRAIIIAIIKIMIMAVPMMPPKSFTPISQNALYCPSGQRSNVPPVFGFAGDDVGVIS